MTFFKYHGDVGYRQLSSACPVLAHRSVLHYMGCIVWSWMLGHLEGSICDKLSSFVVWTQRELAQKWGAWRGAYLGRAELISLLPSAACSLGYVVLPPSLHCICCWFDPLLSWLRSPKPAEKTTHLRGRERVVGSVRLPQPAHGASASDM